MLSGVQHGIQGIHATVNILKAYAEPHRPTIPMTAAQIAWDWAYHHETVVILSAGNGSRMRELKELLSKQEEFPWAEFREPDADNMITSICVVLPERVYNPSNFGIDYRMISPSERELWIDEFNRFKAGCQGAQ
jgi:hypothetical protein